MKRKRTNLYREKLSAGNRSYTIRVSESKKGKKSLLIVETKDGEPRSQLKIPGQYIDDFTTAFEQALKVLKPKPLPAYIIKARLSHPRAFELWTPEEDQKLLKNIQSGVSKDEISILLQRPPGAIQSRLKKLRSASRQEINSEE